MSYSLYPLIYNDIHEKKAKENFNKAFINNKVDFIK
jgi:hypothetical protein